LRAALLPQIDGSQLGCGRGFVLFDLLGFGLHQELVLPRAAVFGQKLLAD